AFALGFHRLSLQITGSRAELNNQWQGRRVSNPQPAVLETAALPIELLPCGDRSGRERDGIIRIPNPSVNVGWLGYCRIFVTTPAPTVLPPSRMAKRKP